MNEETIAPSPNWYLSAILDTSASGSIAYGSKNNIAILSPPTENTSKISRDVNIISLAHRDRVNAVKYGSQSEHKDKLASIGGDGLVKIWDSLTRKLYLAHQAHGENAKLMCVDWSLVDPQLVVSVDDVGMIVTLDLASKTTQAITVPKLHASAMACCRHRRQVVAVGDTVGLVNIIHTAGSGSVLHRMRGHDTTVISLSWSPALGNPMRENSGTEMMLASGAKSRNVLLWRAGTDGKCQTALELPTVPQKLQFQQKEASAMWVPVCWAEPNRLITGSLWGEALQWDLKVIANKQKKLSSTSKVKASMGCSLLTSVHGRGLFSLASSGKSAVDVTAAVATDNWRKPLEQAADEPASSDSGPLIWSVGQDRNVVCSDVGGALLLVLPTVGGFVYCLAASPIDTHKLAFGAGDGVVRVWNMAMESHVDMKTMWMKINGKVTALSWHPTKETWLSYGTSDGRVGIYDTTAVLKGPVRLWNYHQNSVYALGWGPPTYKQGDKHDAATTFYLYSCGDGDLLQYNPDKRDYCMNVLQGVANVAKRTQVTEFAWKQDNSLLVIGTDTGSVMLCQPPHLTILATVYPHKKMIQAMAWHPLTTATEPGGAPARHFMAIASTLSEIKIYDFTPLFKGVENVLDSDACVATLVGHSERVTSVAWSPHISARLVSTSYDNTAQVWDVREGGKLLAVYSGHVAWVYCGIWSPLDADFIMTGSGDFTLRLWRVSAQDTVKPCRKKVSRDIPLALPLTRPAALEGKKKDRIDDPKSSVAPDVDMMNKKSYFPVSSRARNGGKDQLLSSSYALLKMLQLGELSSVVQGVAGEGDLAHLGFFTDTEAMQRLLKLEEEQLVKNNNNAFSQEMALWRSPNFADVLERAKRDKKLTAWHIAMAPMVSPRVWREMTEAFATQLTESGHIHAAVSMLLATRQTKEAVHLLMREKLFREAVAIARCQLSDSDLVKHVVREWATHSENRGDYELAVHCLISVGELERAAQMQGCRRDGASLRLAAHLAQLAGADSLAVKLAQQAVQKCLVDENFVLAKLVVSENTQMKSWLWLVACYEEIIRLRNATRKYKEFATHLWQWFDGPRSTLIPSTVAKCADVSADGVQMMVKCLEALPTNQTQLWLVVSGNIAAACVSDSDTFRHVVKAFSVCYVYEIAYPQSRALFQVITWVLSRTDFDELPESDITISVKAFVCESLAKWIQTLLSHLEDNEENALPLTIDQWDASAKVLCSVASAALDADTIFHFQGNEEIVKCEQALAERRSKRTKEEIENKKVTENIKAKSDVKVMKLDDIKAAGVNGVSELTDGVVELKLDIEAESVNGVSELTDGVELKLDIEAENGVSELTDGVVELKLDIKAEGVNGVSELTDGVVELKLNIEAENGVSELTDGVVELKLDIEAEGVNGVSELTDGVVELKLNENDAVSEDFKSRDWILMTKLLELKSDFVKRRVAAPNPFSVYFKLSCITNNDTGSNSEQELREKIEVLWKEASLKARKQWEEIKAEVDKECPQDN